MTLPTTPSYTPPPGQENHYRQFLREPLEDTLEHLWNYPGRKIALFSAYPETVDDFAAAHCSLEANKIAHSKKYKHLRAQFVVTPLTDIQGRPLLIIERISSNMPQYARPKEGYPILTYLPSPSSILVVHGVGHRIHYLNFDPRLTPMLKLSLDEWASKFDPLADYSFEEDIGTDPTNNTYSVRVFRTLRKQTT